VLIIFDFIYFILFRVILTCASTNTPKSVKSGEVQGSGRAIRNTRTTSYCANYIAIIQLRILYLPLRLVHKTIQFTPSFDGPQTFYSPVREQKNIESI
jgi:hypothetical protein